MKISYNWLKDYVTTALSSKETGELLTNCGLEVEAIEKVETLKGGLRGLVVGEVMSKKKHPDADKLSLTTVDIGDDKLLQIVCGASNVEKGQKVVVATVGAVLHPTVGNSFEIKKSKIRGAISEGMICAEDEIGLGSSHSGIIVLPPEVMVGTTAKEYFRVEEDEVFEIGLTPNRADAASHIGVARDLVAVMNANAKANHQESQTTLRLPNVAGFTESTVPSRIEVIVEDTLACPRYSGLYIDSLTVAESPDWLKNKLKAIDLRPINNVVDITNYVLHETGQPLHAFDATKIKGNKIRVTKLSNKTPFTTLDGTNHELSKEDLMICDADEGLCIAGVFGGIKSGVTAKTSSIFLESAYFNSTSIRKTSKRHSLKTDASFRYERGTDPNITVYALKRAALLLQEITGANINSEIIDIYPQKVEHSKVPFSFVNCQRLIGKKIDHELIKNILLSLDIKIENESNDSLVLSVPPYKVDVTREQDVIEEILRIYGYNNVDISTSLNSSLSFSEKLEKDKLQNSISELLSNNGFSETMSLSLNKLEHYSSSVDNAVKILNPLSNDLNVMRQSLLFSGLENISYNINRKNTSLKIYEFGKTYSSFLSKENEKDFSAKRYIETKHLSLFVTGRKETETWNSRNENVNFFTLKGYLLAIFNRLGIKVEANEYFQGNFENGMFFCWNNMTIAEFGNVSKSILKKMDIKQEVFYADINWDLVIEAYSKNKSLMYSQVPKFPEVRRDLALLIDKSIKFEQLEELAYTTEKKLLREVNLFDIYQGEKLPEGKKSYALSFIFLDEQATLTDKQIEKTMEKLIKIYQEKVGAEIR